ncbi:glycoside hydrolase family 5 protein [Duganella sp. P38]|uniref:glycoside hydrolase family 5 protein n=1 Tax=Duganella sp. P38 TaxID=3423949 RepID=UPI003D7B5107
MLIKRIACCVAVLLAGVARAQAPAPLPMLHTEGTKWLAADGAQPALRGVNLGNYLIQEFWMMGQQTKAVGDQCKLEAVLDQRFGYEERQRLYTLFRDNWITERDWDMLPRLNLNLVRLPFIYSVVEDEKNPRHLRADAWKYLDNAIEQAEKRGIYVILDLHGAVGSQGWEHHSGCAGRNRYWDTPEYQQRTIWLWQQIAARYKDRGAVAGYSILNEPWGTTPENMAAVMRTLYTAIREVDQNHVIILPGHVKGIDAYGKPSDHGCATSPSRCIPIPAISAGASRDWRCTGPGCNAPAKVTACASGSGSWRRSIPPFSSASSSRGPSWERSSAARCCGRLTTPMSPTAGPRPRGPTRW